MWIGGVIERYDSKWGFRFNPDTIIIAKYTIEGAQTTIRFLSEDVECWITLGIAYIGSTVIENTLVSAYYERRELTSHYVRALVNSMLIQV
jgi:hypothetical protein